MAIIQINIPDQHVQRVLDAFAVEYSYQLYVDGGGTMTKAEFAKSRLIQYIKDVVKGVEANAAIRAAESTVTEVSDIA